MMDGWTDRHTNGRDRQTDDRSLRAKTDEWPHKISLDINPKTRMRRWDIPHYANTFVRSIIEEICELFVQSLAHTSSQKVFKVPKENVRALNKIMHFLRRGATFILLYFW